MRCRAGAGSLERTRSEMIYQRPTAAHAARARRLGAVDGSRALGKTLNLTAVAGMAMERSFLAGVKRFWR
jgi:hypothetical protein